MPARRKPRLLKKLHLGAFAELGFQVTYECPRESEFDLLADMSAAVLSPRQMAFSYEGPGLLFIAGLAGSVAEADRAALADWLQSQGRLTSVVVGPLADAWHPPRGVRSLCRRHRRTIQVIVPAVD